MKNKRTQELIIPNVKVLNALRNSGYNNYTAIADIIDNSLESDVDSKNIQIKFPAKGNIDYIKICDDGCGMDLETLKEAIKLGSKSQKNPSMDLGVYGTGLKSASLSIGKRLVVKTKTEDSPLFIAIFDLEEMYEKDTWEIPIYEASGDELSEFIKETGSNNGTIIEISKLDRLATNNPIQFNDSLNKKLGLIFKYFIEEKNIKIFINDENVVGIDPMLRNNHYSLRISNLNEEFIYKDKKYTFNVYFLDRAFKNEIDKTGLGRNSNWAGIYIYRNLRLVGEHLDLGIIGKRGDSYAQGVRVEFFIDGHDDHIFASTFNKIITEKDQQDIDQGFRDILKNMLGSYIADCKKRERVYSKQDKIPNEDLLKTFEDIDKGINSNKVLDIRKLRGKNEKLDDKKSKIKNPRGPQENKNPLKRRDDIWYKTKFENFGEFGKIFDIRIENGVHNVVINIGHVFWTEFLINANIETQKMFVNWFSSSSAALSKLQVNPEVEEYSVFDLLDNYHSELSELIRKMIQF